MQRRTPEGGITTTDEFVEHEPGCVSVTHVGLTCSQAKEAYRRGKFSRSGSRELRPLPNRKVPDVPG